MRYQQLMVLSALASFAAASTVAGVCIALTWRRLALATRTPVVRARALFALRIAPFVFGTLTSVLSVLAFQQYEPRSTAEAPGSILIALAVVGTGVLAAGLWRLCARCSTTYRFLRTIERTAVPVSVPGLQLPAWQVDTAFPLVAVAGLTRSRLLIARSVLAQMPGEELQVVVRHELAHARHRDNIVQLLLTAAPDLIGAAGLWQGLERAWREAAEEAADDFATGADAMARMNLASALVRVARLVGVHPSPRLPLLALHEGESIERRVRRLVEAIEPAGAPRLTARHTTLVVAVAALTLLVTWEGALAHLHEVTEYLVNVRP
jgi:Zn-dependent protease with chaperone function